MRQWTTNEKLAFWMLVATVIGIPVAVPEFRHWLKTRWETIFLPKPVVIASMDFAEQYTLGELIAQMLQDKHVRVQPNFGQSGDDIRKGMAENTVQCYVDYTGALFTLALGQKPKADAAAVYDYVRQEYAKKGIEISKQFKFENPWVILIRRDSALRFRLRRMSDLIRVAASWKAGFVPDFVTDAVAGVDKFKNDYRLTFLHEETLALSSVYKALTERRVDVISGNATDPELLEEGFVSLEDDLHSFPPYYPVIVARRDVIERVPALKEIMEKLPGEIDIDVMRDLNYRVKTQPGNLAAVVRAWRNVKGL